MSNTVAKLHHVAIQTRDFDRAFHFYHKILGLKVVKEPFDFKGKRILSWLDGNGVYIELYSVKKGEDAQHYDDRRVGVDHIAFEFSNLDAVIERFKENSITILKEPFLPPTEDPNQPKVAFIQGPDGEEIEVRECVK